jgi:para-nitrobenzyl esterase
MESPAGPEARIDSGTILGREEGELQVFRGIPYAAPPIGSLRWRPPQPAMPWERLFPAISFGKSCPQPRQFLDMDLGQLGSSEDCLTLNVWTPAWQDGQALLPVMVWIHGGAFFFGAGSEPLYHGEALARLGVVVVTINYRLGPFGFFASCQLDAESAHGTSGNYGLLDQIAALQWVQRNISAFGGNPGNVTIFGESAGAFSVSRLMASPLAAGLFHRAIAQSGGPVGDWLPFLPGQISALENIRRTWRRVSRELGCDREADVAASMRQRSADELMRAKPGERGLTRQFNFIGPVIDGWVLPGDPAKAFREGGQVRVPLLIGINDSEGSLFMRQLPPILPLAYRFLLRRFFGRHARSMLRFFPASSTGEVRRSLDRLLTLVEFATPARFAARTLAAQGVPSFLYRFTRIAATEMGKKLGAHHGAELPYVFGHLDPKQGYGGLDEELSRRMMAAWVAFARSGDPNTPELPAWPRYDPVQEVCLELGDEVRPIRWPDLEACRLAEEILGLA